MKRLNLTTKKLPSALVTAPRRLSDGDGGSMNVMSDARYLRQSSSLVQEYLQKGFDVLQLANGDIVTTGTKTVVHQYIWDDEKGKLVKARKGKRNADGSDETSDEMESEEA